MSLETFPVVKDSLQRWKFLVSPVSGEHSWPGYCRSLVQSLFMECDQRKREEVLRNDLGPLVSLLVYQTHGMHECICSVLLLEVPSS